MFRLGKVYFRHLDATVYVLLVGGKVGGRRGGGVCVCVWGGGSLRNWGVPFVAGSVVARWPRDGHTKAGKEAGEEFGSSPALLTAQRCPTNDTILLSHLCLTNNTMLLSHCCPTNGTMILSRRCPTNDTILSHRCPTNNSILLSYRCPANDTLLCR